MSSPIVIVLVGEKNNRITEIAEAQGKILETANLILKRSDSSIEQRKCFEQHGYYFCTLTDGNGTTFLCVSSMNDQKSSFGLLGTIRQEYEAKNYLQADVLTPFEDFIEEQMDQYPSKVKQVQRQVDDVKVIALDNIKKQLNNIDDLQHVQGNASRLGNQAAMFDTTTNRLKWYERRRNLVVTIALGASGFLLLAIVIAILVYIFR